MEIGTNKQIPALISSVLSGAWRISTESPNISPEDLESVVPVLVGSMAGGLAWWKIRGGDLCDSPGGRELLDAYRFHSIRSALREHTIKKVLDLLASARIEPILIKGWVAARYYPEPGLRPYGDIDLVVRPDQYQSANALAKEIRGEYGIDLHRGFADIDLQDFDELFERTKLLSLDETRVRVLSDEDHLRLLCVHMLHHNVFRPLWLCDIGAAVEGLSSDFDWDLCFGRNRRRADWVSSSVALAHRLLGADLRETPVEIRNRNVPDWLISSVFKQWETPYSLVQAPVTHAAPMVKYLRDPRGLFADLRRRWPGPIEATVYTGGRFNGFPRWPFQIGECLIRTARFVAQTGREKQRGAA